MANADPLTGGSPVTPGGFAALAHTNPYPMSSGVRSALAGSGYTQKPSFSSTAPGVDQSPSPPGQSGGGGQGAPAAPAPPPSPFDPAADPIVQQIRALGQSNVQQAEATALAGKKQELIGYGYDPALSNLYPDQSTADAAQQNPFSFLANAQHDYGQRTSALDEALNKQNLFYSSTRANDLGENARGYQQQLATGAGGLQQGLGALEAALLGARQTAAGNDLNAQQRAFNKYTPPETVAQPPVQPPDQPTVADLLTPQLPPFNPNETTLPTFDPSQTRLPKFAAPNTTDQLPISTGNPLDDQLLAELARPKARRQR